MFTAVANKRKLDIATSVTDDVTPIYILEELWSILQTSGPETSEGFVGYMTKRLQHKSPIVKQKTLRVIKFLCEKGASTFKRNISKAAKPVRDLEYYRGEPDPFKGDTLNQKVRDQAKEAVAAIFAPTETPSYQASQSALQSRIKGFGNSNMSETVAPSAKPASGMLGFGSSKYSSDFSSGSAKPPTSSAWNYKSDYDAPESSNRESSGREKEGFGGMMKRVSSGALSPKGIINMVNSKSNERRHGSRGQSILQDEDDEGGHETDEEDRVYTKPSLEAAPSNSTHPKSAPRKPVNKSGEEARLVIQVCTHGGVRAQPSPEELRVFVESVGSLSGEEVACQLENKLEDPSWQAVLRSLCVIEAVIKQGSSAACGEIAVHFQTDPSAIVAAEGFPQASVRQRALRVLELLGVSENPKTSRAAPAATQSTTTAVPDLLGGLDADTSAESPADNTPQQTYRQTGGSELLGDLMGGGPSIAPTASQGADLFSGFEVASGGQSGDSARQNADLFDGLAMGGTLASQPAPMGAPLQPPSSSNDLNDLFSATTISPAPQIRSSAGPSFPAGLSMGHSPQAQAVPDLYSGSLGMTPISQARGDQPPVTNGAAVRLRQQHMAHQRSASIDKMADPLSSLGLPQAAQTPMALSSGMNQLGMSQQGMSQQSRQGQQPLASSGMLGGRPAGGPAGGSAMPQQLSQLTPQQLQHLTPQQRQYITQQIQQMRQAQSGGQFGQAMTQQATYQSTNGSGLQGQWPSQPNTGLDSGYGFTGSVQSQGAPSLKQPQQLSSDFGLGGLHSQAHPNLMQSTPLSSAKIGISQQTDFDFVNDHVRGLRGKK